MTGGSWRAASALRYVALGRAGHGCLRPLNLIVRRLGFVWRNSVRNQDLRPPLWVGHVALETNRLEESAQFMLTIGMRTRAQRVGGGYL